MAERDETLVRAVGVRGLAATAFNVTIGGGIFVLPAVVAGSLGRAAPAAILVCALAMALIVLCFAEAGSRVSLTGGPYAYVETALGPFVGFLAGVLLWLLGSFATAAVASAFAGSVAALLPVLGAPLARSIVLVALFALLAAVNVTGVRQGTRLIEVVTVAKLLPLIALVLAGLVVAGARLPSAVSFAAPPAALGRAVIVMIFMFAGIESALVPSGELRDPARTVPRALLIAMTGVTALYLAIQIVAQGVLGTQALAAETTAPLVAVGRAIAGPAGALIIAAGASISMFGQVSGMTLATPRALYAFGRDGFLPGWLAAVHPRFRTPYMAIVVQAGITCVLAATGNFAQLAILANVSVLVLYLLCCVAAWQLQRRDVRAGGIPFRVPGAGVIPLLAVAVILWILSHATLREFAVVGAVLAAGSLLFMLTLGRRARAEGIP
ncbi:MAG: APC family permease [Gemmatimonadota bacterium]|nr:APC family permease [Gemmatimonadota bacterium]